MVVANEDHHHQEEQNLVYGIRLSSVVPGTITGENKYHELRGIDLAMKLHYIKGLYFFNKDASISHIDEMKKPTFDWLIPYFMVCGRVRTGPHVGGTRGVAIKLNDAGIRIVEARSRLTVDEWFGMDGFMSQQDQLVYGHGLGPDLGFTPLVFIQVTWFECGGISVGLNWAHILGDVFSASAFMNMLGQYMQGHYKGTQILPLSDPPKPTYPISRPTHEPRSLKRVDPVGDHWVAATNCKMSTYTFHLSSTQLVELHSRAHAQIDDNNKMITQCFEVISAIMWKAISKIRRELEPKVVTICRPKSIDRERMIPYNGQVVATIEADCLISETNISELVSLIANNVVDASGEVEDFVDEETSKLDFIIYGANLTFVDMEKANIYGFKVEGQCPTFASYSIGGVGEQGAIMVLPGSSNKNEGKLILVTLPEDELEGLKSELKEEWGIM